MIIDKSENRVEFSGELSLTAIDATASQLDALGPVGKKTTETMRALATAIQGLENSTAYLRLVTTMIDGTPQTELELKAVNANQPSLDPAQSALRLSDFRLCIRTKRQLDEAGIFTVGDLTKKTTYQLLTFHSFPKGGLDEIKEVVLEPLGITLGEQQPKFNGNFGASAELLSKKIDNFALSIRLHRALKKMNIRTVQDLIQHSESDYLAFKGFSAVNLEEIKENILGPNNLKLRPDQE